MKYLYRSILLIIFLVSVLCLHAFAEDDMLIIPESMRVIEEEAFYGDQGIREIRMPEGLTSIGDRAFYNCAGLERVYIPDTVTTIGVDAFGGCDSVCIYCSMESNAREYASQNHLDCYLVDAAPQKPYYPDDPSYGTPVFPYETDDWAMSNDGIVIDTYSMPEENYDGIRVYLSPDNGQTWSCVDDYRTSEWQYDERMIRQDLQYGRYLVTFTRYSEVNGRIYESEMHVPSGFSVLDTPQLDAEIIDTEDEEEGVLRKNIRLSWTEDEVADGYVIYRYVGDDCDATFNIEIQTDEFVDDAAQEGVVYSYRLRSIAYVNTGDVTWSAMSDPVQIGLPKNTEMIVCLAVNGDSSLAGGGKTLSLEADYYPEEGVEPNLTWTSSDPSIASVDENGVVTSALEVSEDATVTITCTANDGSGLTAQHDVTVLSNRLYSFGNYNITSVKLTTAYMNAWPADANADKYKDLFGCSKSDDSAEQMFALEPVTGHYDWYRLRVMEYGGKYASVSTSKGTMTNQSGSTIFKVVKNGSNISLLSTDGTKAVTLGALLDSSETYRYNVKMSAYSASNKAQQWKITKKSATLTTNVSSITMNVGESKTVTAYITSDGSGNKPPLLFSSSDTSVATVTKAGVIKAVGAGKATITVKTVSGITKTVSVTVNIVDPNNRPSIQFSKKTMSVNENLCFTIPLTVTGYTGRFQVKMTVSDASFDIVSTKFTSINQTLVQLGKSGVIFKVGGSSLSTAKPNSKSRKFYATGASMKLYVGGNYKSSTGNRTVTLTLQTPSDSSYVVGENSTLTLTLVDVDAKRPASKAGLTRSQYVAKCVPWLAAKYPSDKYWNHYIGAVNNDNTVSSKACDDTNPHNPKNCTLDGWCDGTHSLYQGSVVCNKNEKWDSRQCMGFALKVATDIFGSNPMKDGTNWTKYTSYSKLGNFEPGDYVRHASSFYKGSDGKWHASEHSYIILDVNGDTLTTLECNRGGNCVIFRNTRSVKTEKQQADTETQKGKFLYVFRYTGW